MVPRVLLALLPLLVLLVPSMKQIFKSQKSGEDPGAAQAQCVVLLRDSYLLLKFTEINLDVQFRTVFPGVLGPPRVLSQKVLRVVPEGSRRFEKV